MKKNKLVVYTALFGDYDELVDPAENFDDCDFICFTDQKHLKSDIWEIQIIDKLDLPSNMMNRKYKILPHLYLSEYEWSLYIDSNIAILKNPIDLANKYLYKNDFVAPKHFARDCIYEEANACIILGKAKYNEIQNQMNEYRADGFPRKFGLSENGILLRRHNNEKVIKLMNDWWKEMNNKTQRDQLSLGYVLWKNDMQFIYMDESARDGKFFFLFCHNNDSILLEIKNKLKYYLAKFNNSLKILQTN